MHLNSLALVNYKNYEEASLEFTKDINVFIGENGAGKTNLLDAVYYLSYCRSFLNPVDKQSIRIGEKFFVIQGDFDREDKSIGITCAIKKGKRKRSSEIRKNTRNCQIISDSFLRLSFLLMTRTS